MADQFFVQPDGHHLGMLGIFSVENVDGVTEESKQVIRGAESADHFTIVVGQRIQDDQVRVAVESLPEPQFVAIVIAVVKKAAVLIRTRWIGTVATPIAIVVSCYSISYACLVGEFPSTAFPR